MDRPAHRHRHRHGSAARLSSHPAPDADDVVSTAPRSLYTACRAYVLYTSTSVKVHILSAKLIRAPGFVQTIMTPIRDIYLLPAIFLVETLEERCALWIRLRLLCLPHRCSIATGGCSCSSSASVSKRLHANTSASVRSGVAEKWTCRVVSPQ